MLICFTKMHGLGNDFVVIDNRQLQLQLTAQQIQLIADRHFGVGCDQLLLIEDSRLEQIDFKYRIFNQDGMEVQQCGNGARCFALYVSSKGLTNKSTLAVETLAGIIYLYLDTNNEAADESKNEFVNGTKSKEIGQQTNVRVNMGLPDFSPQQLPFLVDDPIAIKNNHYQLELLKAKTKLNNCFTFSAVSMGNPHISLFIKELKNYDVATVGDLLSTHPAFPEGVNVGFIQLIDRNNILLRVFERGAGETLACGSGACAAVVNGIQQGVLNHQVRVQLTAGDLMIKWGGELTQAVWMSGPASFVFEGQIEI